MTVRSRDRGQLLFQAVLVFLVIGLMLSIVFYLYVADSDGAALNEELAAGTNPLIADTDGDGLTDGRELEIDGVSPLTSDSDGDGLNDGREVTLGTDPLHPDTDRDGIPDVREVRLKLDLDPTSNDTDDDGLHDKRELNGITDPVDPDTDGDGLRDGNEFRFGSSPLKPDTDNDNVTDSKEFALGLDPADSDTDNDGLSDSREINMSTDPADADTDNDLLDDGAELAQNTSPTNSDTDGDGLPDGVEVYGSSHGLTDADPLRRDVFLEIDRHPDSSFQRDGFEQLKETYADAPVSNPDGSTGVTVHLHFDSVVSVDSSLSDETYFSGVYNETFDRRGWGYRHILIVGEVKSSKTDAEVGGITRVGRHGALVRGYGTDRATGGTAMHELGHILGLTRDDYRGIDSRDVSTETYPSVMNYNQLGSTDDLFLYSSSTVDGDGFDDWSHLAAGFEQPPLGTANSSVESAP